MSYWVVAGTVVALVLIVVSVLGPHEWKHPPQWHLPEVFSCLLIWFGSNAFTAAIRLFVILLQGDVGLRGPRHGFETLTQEDITTLLGGTLAAAVMGIGTVRVGMRRAVAARADTPQA